MEYLKFIVHTKGLSELPSRLMLILKRFGFTEKKLKDFLSDTDDLLKPYHVCPTVFITASLAEKRPYIVDWFEKVGWEIAIHGYTHVNYKKLPAHEQLKHVKKAKYLLSNGVPQAVGFRAPYLSWNRHTTSALIGNDISWSSHQSVLWDCLKLKDFKERDVANYQRALTILYNPKPAAKFPVIPYFKDGLLEIPISLPDDEILIDRLRISDSEQLFDIWNEMLLQAYERGDLFTLLLHPERAGIYSSVIRRLIEKSISMERPIWIANLNEISNWWKEKTLFEIGITKIDHNQYRINVTCSARASLLMKKPESFTDSNRQKTSNGYSAVMERDFIVESKIKPILGISTEVSPQLQQFLKNEGLPFEIAVEGEHYAYRIEACDNFQENQVELLDKIEKSQVPFLKFSRWPNQYKSAFSLTYDLDAVTLFDFGSRMFDFSSAPITSIDMSRPNRLPPSKMVNSNQKKKIWIDLENSPHVLFFSPIINKLSKEGFEILLTSRDCSQVSVLAELFHLKHKQIGHHFGKNKILKVIGLLYRSLQLLPTIMKERPDFALSHGSRSQLLAAKIMQIPSAIAVDYEHSKGLLLIHPDWAIVPDIIPEEAVRHWTKAILRYPGIKEDVYVPSFVPDKSIKDQLGFLDEELMITVRPPAMDAHYYTQESGALFEYVIDFLGQIKNVRMILLPRNKSQEAFITKKWPDLYSDGNMVIPKYVVNGLNLIWYSDLVISGGGTMNREAAALGVPVYSIFRGKLGAVDKYLSDSGRLFLIESPEDVRNKIKLAPRNKTDKLMNRTTEALDTIVDHISRIVSV